MVFRICGVKIVPDKPLTPVEIMMKVTTKYRSALRKDSVTSLSTAGVLGETYIDIDSSHSKSQEVSDGDTLATRETPDKR